jgi:hypothetical protein
MRPTPQPGERGLRIYVPQWQGGPAVPPGTGFPFVAFCVTQGYGGGILTRLHTGLIRPSQVQILPSELSRFHLSIYDSTTVCWTLAAFFFQFLEF